MALSAGLGRARALAQPQHSGELQFHQMGRGDHLDARSCKGLQLQERRGGARRAAAADRIVAVASRRAFGHSIAPLDGRSGPGPSQVRRSTGWRSIGGGSRPVAAAESDTAYVWGLRNPLGDIVLRTRSVRIYSATFTPDD